MHTRLLASGNRRNMDTNWSLDEIRAKLRKVNGKGFLSIPPGMYRRDEGVVGQVLEREFGISENNVSVGDLGDFELKGMRARSNKMTLCHKTTEVGLSPIEVYDRFGYVKPSNRDKSVLKKKLFTTVTGTRANSLGLILKPSGKSSIDMFFGEEFICGWHLEESLKKIDRIILVLADTRGETASKDEEFHYVQAYLYNGLKSVDELVGKGIIVIDFCIDQVMGSRKVPHDRGPHIRIPKSKLGAAFRDVRLVFP